ncbi:hypothetical protein D3C84_970750 [compost metagenome]
MGAFFQPLAPDRQILLDGRAIGVPTHRLRKAALCGFFQQCVNRRFPFDAVGNEIRVRLVLDRENVLGLQRSGVGRFFKHRNILIHFVQRQHGVGIALIGFCLSQPPCFGQ